MRILWITNVPLPEASLLMKEPPTVFGGWLTSTSTHLSELDGVEIVVAFPKKNIEDIQTLRGKKIEYHMFPLMSSRVKNTSKIHAFIQTIIEEVKPDLVHIFGTEFEHSTVVINVCKKLDVKTVVSIQGLVSVISKHYRSNLPFKVVHGYSFRDFVKRDNILKQQKRFMYRGISEIAAIKGTNNIVGRTSWDKACTSQINPDAKYHFCNETLRDEFYGHSWHIDECERYSIFTTQATYPIKGLHFLLEAMSIVLRKYPRAKLYISGQNIMLSETLNQKFRRSTYTKYLKSLISKNKMEDSIVFTGVLDAVEMREKYLKSHVFVSPSSIENSPNSLGESMMLGVPSIASYVGGVPDLMKDKEEGFLYQHNAPYMLANFICELFDNDSLALKYSENAKKRALRTHDKEINTKRLIDIYTNVIGECKRKSK